MPRNISGTFSLYTPGNPVVTGTTISSVVHNNTMSDIATALTQSIASDGTTIITANLPMGGFKFTGVGNATARDQFAAAGQVQDSAFTWGGTATKAVAATISSITNVGTTATLNTATPHGLVTGAEVVISGTTPAAYSGTFTATVVDADTFTYTMLSDPGSSASIVGAYTVDLYLITLTPAITAYTAGQRFTYLNAATANTTTTPYISVSGLVPVVIKKQIGTALGIGDLISGAMLDMEYDGTGFRLTSVAQSTIDQAGIGTSTTTTGAVNITLTPASSGYQSVIMTAAGKHVTLPDATALNVGGPRYFITNDGGYPIGVRDSTGVLLTGIAAGGRAELYLKDISTAAGIWGVNGINLEPGLITIDSTLSSTFTSAVLAPFVALDSNTSIHFAALSAGFSAFVVDNAGKVISTPVTVTTTASSVPKTIFKISSTTAILFYGASTTDHQSVVLTLTGASPAFSLSVGTPVALVATLASAWGGEDFVTAPRFAQLSTTLYLASYMQINDVRTVAISVSGTTITMGAPLTITATGTSNSIPTPYAVSSTSSVVLYATGGAPAALNAVVISVSGTTCTAGAANTASSTWTATGGVAGGIASCQLTSTKLLVLTDNNNTTAVVHAVTVTGTTVAFGAAHTADSSVTGFQSSGLAAYTANSATRYNPHLFPTSATTALLWYTDSSSISRAVTLAESAGVVTSGTKLYRSISVAASNTAGYGQIMPQGANEFVALRQQLSNTAGYELQISPNKISGTNVTAGAGLSMREIYQDTPANYSLGKLTSGDYILLGLGTSAIGQSKIPVFRTNGDYINMRGYISVPELSLGAVIPVPNPASNRFSILGSTASGTTVAAATNQLRLINLEIAA